MPAERASWKPAMITVSMQKAVEPAWLNITSRIVGERGAVTGSTPDSYVTVALQEAPYLRIDVYGGLEPECTTFQEALYWRGWIVIGFGERIHLVPITAEDRDIKTLFLGDYFSALYPTDGYLLAASGTRLFRVTVTGEIAWKTEWLGVDGVLVSDIQDGIICGQGEHDPPGGWRPFEVDLATGAVVRGD